MSARGGDDDGDDDLAAALVDRLRAAPARAVPTSGLGRIARTASAAARTAGAALSGRLRRRGDGGLAGADLAAIEKLVTSLGELKGVAMKAGQMLGYLDESLPAEMRSLLSVLQTQSQPAPFEAVAATVREDVGAAADELLARLDPAPVSVASIGQVHRGRLPDGTDVAVKVRHPGIDVAIRSDFRAAGVGKVMARLLAPGGAAAVRDNIAEAEARFLEECDYRLEAERQERFGRLFAGHPVVVVPAVHRRWSGPRVLTTTWEPGLGLDAFLAGDPAPALRDRLGAALFEVYLGTLYRHGIFHADPHPGNYAFRGDGRLVVFDYGCVREFEPELVRALVALGAAVRADDEPAIRAALVGLGAQPPDDLGHVRGLLRGFFAPMLTPGRHPIDAAISVEMRQVVKDKRAIVRMQLPASMLFLFRIRFGLYAVLARLGAVCDWSALETSFAAQLKVP